MKYNLDYFIAKFKAIPEENWCMGFLVEGTSRCVNGHCGITDYSESTEESEALYSLFKDLSVTRRYGEEGLVLDYLGVKENFSLIALNINDDFTNEYRQATPKQRIMAALYDLKAKQPKTIIKYVAVSDTLRCKSAIMAATN